MSFDELQAAAREAHEQRFVPEIRMALAAAPDVRVWPPNWADIGSIDYFYRSSSLLVRDADLGRVGTALDALGAMPLESPSDIGGQATPDLALIDGLTRMRAHVRESQHTADVVKDLDDRLGIGVATHEHAFTVSYGIGCPATEPEPVLTPQAAESPVAVSDALWPPVGEPFAGQGVRISVIDTGLLAGASAWAPWLEGVQAAPADIEDPDQLHISPSGITWEADGYADPYAGHGTFISGVIRCVAPGASVSVQRYAGTAGFVVESSLVTQIYEGLASAADIFSMSAGGYTRNNLPPLSFQTLWDKRLSRLGGIAFVAAAGNDNVSDPFWPAAFPWCVGVGSMSRDGQRRSWFSNHGSWVDVYAPGEEIVNAYPRLPYKTIATQTVRDTSAGLASWSGTSFATPIVAGLIASRMSRTGENGKRAADSLLAAARGQFRASVGPRLFP